MSIEEAIARLKQYDEVGWTGINDYYLPALKAILEWFKEHETIS